MRSKLPFLLLTLVLASCGSSPSTSKNASTTAPTVAGPFEFALSSSGGNQGFLEMDISQSGSSLSIHYQAIINQPNTSYRTNWNICGENGGGLSGTVTGTTFSVNSSTEDLSGTINSNGTITGMYQPGTNPCIPVANTFVATPVTKLQGTFSGTLTDSSGNNVTVTLSITTDPSTITANGGYAMSGSGTAFDQGATENLSFSGYVQAALFQITQGTTSDVNGQGTFTAIGHFNPAANSLSLGVVQSNGLNYSGVLTKQ